MIENGQINEIASNLKGNESMIICNSTKSEKLNRIINQKYNNKLNVKIVLWSKGILDLSTIIKQIKQLNIYQLNLELYEIEDLDLNSIIIDLIAQMGISHLEIEIFSGVYINPNQAFSIGDSLSSLKQLTYLKLNLNCSNFPQHLDFLKFSKAYETLHNLEYLDLQFYRLSKNFPNIFQILCGIKNLNILKSIFLLFSDNSIRIDSLFTILSREIGYLSTLNTFKMQLGQTDLVKFEQFASLTQALTQLQNLQTIKIKMNFDTQYNSNSLLSLRQLMKKLQNVTNFKYQGNFNNFFFFKSLDSIHTLQKLNLQINTNFNSFHDYYTLGNTLCQMRSLTKLKLECKLTNPFDFLQFIEEIQYSQTLESLKINLIQEQNKKGEIFSHRIEENLSNEIDVNVFSKLKVLIILFQELKQNKSKMQIHKKGYFTDLQQFDVQLQNNLQKELVNPPQSGSISYQTNKPIDIQDRFLFRVFYNFNLYECKHKFCLLNNLFINRLIATHLEQFIISKESDKKQLIQIDKFISQNKTESNQIIDQPNKESINSTIQEETIVSFNQDKYKMNETTLELDQNLRQSLSLIDLTLELNKQKFDEAYLINLVQSFKHLSKLERLQFAIEGQKFEQSYKQQFVNQFQIPKKLSFLNLNFRIESLFISELFNLFETISQLNKLQNLQFEVLEQEITQKDVENLNVQLSKLYNLINLNFLSCNPLALYLIDLFRVNIFLEIINFDNYSNRNTSKELIQAFREKYYKRNIYFQKSINFKKQNKNGNKIYKLDEIIGLSISMEKFFLYKNIAQHFQILTMIHSLRIKISMSNNFSQDIIQDLFNGIGNLFQLRILELTSMQRINSRNMNSLGLSLQKLLNLSNLYLIFDNNNSFYSQEINISTFCKSFQYLRNLKFLAIYVTSSSLFNLERIEELIFSISSSNKLKVLKISIKGSNMYYMEKQENQILQNFNSLFSNLRTKLIYLQIYFLDNSDKSVILKQLTNLQQLQTLGTRYTKKNQLKLNPIVYKLKRLVTYI